MKINGKDGRMTQWTNSEKSDFTQKSKQTKLREENAYLAIKENNNNAFLIYK